MEDQSPARRLAPGTRRPAAMAGLAAATSVVVVLLGQPAVRPAAAASAMSGAARLIVCVDSYPRTIDASAAPVERVAVSQEPAPDSPAANDRLLVDLQEQVVLSRVGSRYGP